MIEFVRVLLDAIRTRNPTWRSNIRTFSLSRGDDGKVEVVLGVFVSDADHCIARLHILPEDDAESVQEKVSGLLDLVTQVADGWKV